MDSAAAELQMVRAALDAVDFGLCMVDTQGRIVSANAPFATMVDMPLNELVGSLYLSILPAFQGNAEFNKLFSMSDDESVTELAGSGSGEPTKHLLLRATSMTVEADRFRVLSAFDINRMNSTRSQFAMLRREFEKLQGGVTIADARAPDMPLIYCNRAFTDMTGYSRAESLGKNCRFLQGEATDPAAVQSLAAAVAAGEPCQTIIKNYRRNGDSFDNELFITPVFDNHGELAQFVGFQREVVVDYE